MKDDFDSAQPGPGKPDLQTLSAFADNELPIGERTATFVQLLSDSESAVRVAGYRAQKAALAALFAVSQEDAPTIIVRRRPPWWRQAGAAVSYLAMGMMLGSALVWVVASFFNDQQGFAKRADIAYAVYAPEVRHPVEVSAVDDNYLVKWLSRRLDRPLSAPSLREYGYSLIGGRLLPDEYGPAAQLMYENTAGSRLTLYVAAVSTYASAFRRFRDGNRSTFYWISQRAAYALTGHVADPQLRSIAIDVCSALQGY